MSDEQDTEPTIAERLAAPFGYDDLQFRPTATRNDGRQALMVAYLDASAVAQRLDDVVGIEGWSDTYKVIDDKTVECELTLFVGGTLATGAARAITKADVGVVAAGGFDETLKSGYSDALKRAARKWGIGRYLAVLGGTWMEYDPETKRAKGRPPLPGTGTDTADRPATAPPRPATASRESEAHDGAGAGAESGGERPDAIAIEGSEITNRYMEKYRVVLRTAVDFFGGTDGIARHFRMIEAKPEATENDKQIAAFVLEWFGERGGDGPDAKGIVMKFAGRTNVDLEDLAKALGQEVADLTPQEKVEPAARPAVNV